MPEAQTQKVAAAKMILKILAAAISLLRVS
jgi:hypothetical protein